MEKLSSLENPPPKSSWNVNGGDGYYAAFVLRLEDSLDALIASLKQKRPLMPLTQYADQTPSSNTEEESLQIEKDLKKQQELEFKKLEMSAKKKRAEEIFTAAKQSRENAFNALDPGNDSDFRLSSDSEDDPEVIPRRSYTELKATLDLCEKEKDELERKVIKLQKECDNLKQETQEIATLRSLNFQLQERLLKSFPQGECSHESSEDVEVNLETMEVELGAGISINKKVYQGICELDDVRKFTKSLAVAIWGSDVLAGRSVKGRACRNRNGPKKVDVESTPTHSNQQQAKPPLTPEKLAVISGQMREYLVKRKRDCVEIEKELKKRNKYLSDKIQDICSRQISQ
ncbi:BEN domain-containing protein 5-like [Uloborus diversus]|uniref:BEN domain-containing protein 5-like n=1 Tax=Uloborus diversus TaxID=327109 RepID=UPI0024096E27|nr:BEN domain-containing protein 5-like [Uloborus diversus]